MISASTSLKTAIGQLTKRLIQSEKKQSSLRSFPTWVRLTTNSPLIYEVCIPKPELQTLQNHIIDWKLRDLRRQYQTQQKAKSAILTAQSQNELNDLGTIADELIQQLDSLLNPERSRTDQSTKCPVLQAYAIGTDRESGERW